MSTPTIAVVAAGAMGAAIGARLRYGGARVLTALEGRSEPTVERARRAGMMAVPFEELARADLFLSVVPPDHANATARRFATAAAVMGRVPRYADLNAVSPSSVRGIADIIGRCGAAFTDGGIIGGPPRHGERGPTIYLSGEDDSIGTVLRAHGLDARHVAREIGTASALKMSYAGITKGITALGAAMFLAAKRAGVADLLVAELQSSQQTTLERLQKTIPDMLPKAYRWAPEMREIAEFIGSVRPEHAIFDDLAEFYVYLAQGDDADTLRAGFSKSLPCPI